EKLTELVGGHPYLLKVAFEHLKTSHQVSLDDLLVKAATNEGIYRSHLQEYWLNLDNDPELAAIFKAVVTSDSPIQIISPKQLYKLESRGLIAVDGNKTKPRCQLYRLYFREQLGVISSSRKPFFFRKIWEHKTLF
ncbi:MAG: AAA-like domain-containing protein, partial [Microcystaceae cyanobacterium]